MGKATIQQKRKARAKTKKQKSRKFRKKHRNTGVDVGEAAHQDRLDRAKEKIMLEDGLFDIKGDERLLRMDPKMEDLRKLRMLRKKELLETVEELRTAQGPDQVHQVMRREFVQKDVKEKERKLPTESIETSASKHWIEEALERELANEKVPKDMNDLWTSGGNVKPRRKKKLAISPHPGQSYNPDSSEFQEAVTAALTTELMNISKEERIERQFNIDWEADYIKYGGDDVLDGVYAARRAEQSESIPIDEQRKMPKYGRFYKTTTLRQKLGKKQQKYERLAQRRNLRPKQTIKEIIEEVDNISEKRALMKKKKRERRRNKFLKEERRKRSGVLDTKDIMLDTELPNRISGLGANKSGYFADRTRVFKYLHDDMFKRGKRSRI